LLSATSKLLRLLGLSTLYIIGGSPAFNNPTATSVTITLLRLSFNSLFTEFLIY